MNQFFFGDPDRPLYGVHHPPASDRRKDSAVLICYPIGREYMRCHRALVRLCNQLGQAGYHSMRFDYSGTGDSEGDGTDVDIDMWISDITTAALELKEVSGARKISMVGVRLGAAVATYAAARQDFVDQLFLWDPITDGKHYLQQLIGLHQDFVTDRDRFPRSTVDEAADEDGELVGMPFPDKLRESIQKIELGSIPALGADQVTILATEDRPQYQSSLDHLDSLVDSTSYKVVNEPVRWESLSDLGAVILPHKILEQIVALADGNAA
ncbi:MAG: serine aminopeptidase domain-containing protein [Gammaproteobacteria bacterium]